MKLAEAKSRLGNVRETITDLKDKVSICPLQEISTTLTAINELVFEGRNLRRSINKVEHDNVISGSSISELELTVELLEEQINIFRCISKRSDLPESLVSLIFSQLDSFVKTKSQLQSALQKASWEIEAV